ncbi:MAG TPA: peroxiredoxin-like family protein [Pseudonocardiaceae bacterium]|jgi:peroxiredoxin|nr:peroxiredoxin-like family protein [Pseudonocardiaceae bacterium]
MTTTDQTYATKVAALKDGIAAKAPAEVLSVFAAEQAELAAAGVPSALASVGTAIPDADLLDARGEATTLGRELAGKPAVLVFYRGAWCPFCNLALRTYQEQVVEVLADKGIGFFAVSPQKPDGSLSIVETNELTFGVLSDAGNKIATKLGVLNPERGQEARAAAAALGADVAGGNGDGTDNLPMPTTVVVDAAGIIRWIDVHPDYTERTEPQAILDAVAATIG